MKKKEKLLKLDKKIENKLKSSLMIIDKKEDKTSADEVYELRRIFKNKERKKCDKIKIGHSGTLDPKVTGVLVMGLGKGTKVLEYILLSKKVYETEIIFHKKVNRVDFAKVLKKFTGKITQLPPVKSAVKRQEREREIYDLDLTFFSGDGRVARFVSSVERGTYIRKLCHNIGELLGGAHMGNLRRIQAGVFSLKNSRVVSVKKVKELYDSEKIKDKEELLSYLYDVEELLIRLDNEDKIRKIFVKDESVKYIKSGNSVRINNLSNGKYRLRKDEIYSLFCDMGQKDELLGIGISLVDESFTVKESIGFSDKELIKMKKVI